MSPTSGSSESSRRRFATTSWSLVVEASGDSSPQQHVALQSLCQSYWYPLYAFLRKRHPREEAEDITQSFFVDLLEHRRLGAADQNRGRFRSFLLSSLSNFRSNWVRNRRTQKRGGGLAPLSLDFESADQRYALEPADEMTPERLFDRSWAMTLLQRAISRLEEQYQSAGKGTLFERLKGYLNRSAEVPYAQAAEDLKMSSDAVRVAVHRLRKRCQDLLRHEIAQTVAGPEDVDAELQELFSLF